MFTCAGFKHRCSPGGMDTGRLDFGILARIVRRTIITSVIYQGFRTETTANYGN